MQMISFVFFAFLALVFVSIRVCNLAVKEDSAKVLYSKWILLVASYAFVLYADYRFALVLGLLTLVTWACAQKKPLINYAIIAAILSLAYFKYTNFFMESFSRLLGKTDYTALNIILPLGISFYAFSAISYLMDVKRGKVAVSGLLDVALYLSFFPKITSGPIQRSSDFFNQINKPRNVNWNSLSIGLQIFCFGLFKKIVLADRLSVFVNQVYATPLAFSGLTVLLAVLAYSLQIYFDFSGYSDIAIGVAQMLDVRLPRNFNLPYLSHNVTELWKRWHISLSSWLQEYLYISLGGNRKGVARTYCNLILTMVIGGLWHGSSWTFVIWGLLHGVALAVHKLWVKWTRSNEIPHHPLSNVLSILMTFGFTSFCWIFFRAESIPQAMQILGQIVRCSDGVQHPYIWLFFALLVLIISCVAAYINTKDRSLPQNRTNQSFVNGYYPLLDFNNFWHLVWFFVFCGLIIGLAYTGGSPFIYGAF